MQNVLGHSDGLQNYFFLCMYVLQFHDAFMKHLSIDKGISRKNGCAQKQEWAFKNDFKSLPIQYSQN